MDSTPELTPERKATDEAKEEPVFRDATKQLLIKSLPPVLTLHMKRFLQDGRRLRKNGRHIDFPEILDVAPFCNPDCKVHVYHSPLPSSEQELNYVKYHNIRQRFFLYTIPYQFRVLLTNLSLLKQNSMSKSCRT